MPCVCTIVGPPTYGAIADALHRHKQVHVWCHVLSALFIFSLQFVKSFPLMCVLVFASYFHMVPTLSLLDVAAMKLTEKHGGDFGKQRLYGALGYGIGGYVSGMMASAIGIKWCFTMMLGVSCISLFLLVVYIPAGYGDEEDKPRQKGLLRTSVKLVLSRADVMVLFVIALVTGVSGGFVDSYLFLNVYDLSDDGATIVSVFVAVETLSEIPIFYLANPMIERFGTTACITVSVVAYFVRDIAYVYMEQPWYYVPLETLHGITFGLLLSALTIYIYGASPKHMSGTMIGLLSAFQRGIGAGTASLVGGHIYDKYGVRTMWKVGAYGLFPATMVFVVLFAWLAKRERVETDLEQQLVESVSIQGEIAKSPAMK